VLFTIAITINHKRTIVAADLTSNLFGINGCTADKLYCNQHDSIVIWTNQIIDQCAFDVLLRTDLYIEDDDILVDRENKNTNCFLKSLTTEPNLVLHHLKNATLYNILMFIPQLKGYG
jgi:hypothetical protein